MARHDNHGFAAGLLLGGLVGAAMALLATPRGSDLARGALGSLGLKDPEAVLERSREALRLRFQRATTEAEQAATATQRRLEAEYRGGAASS